MNNDVYHCAHKQNRFRAVLCFLLLKLVTTTTKTKKLLIVDPSSQQQKHKEELKKQKTKTPHHVIPSYTHFQAYILQASIPQTKFST